jgi:outer membrane receptor protein involved in Fe transport
VLTSADAGYWFPARQDLDTVLNKIDAGIIRDIVVIKGPYSVRYGPGLSFIDVETVESPRFDSGLDWRGRTSLNYSTNGENWYGRDSIAVGDANWGLRMGYGHRTGSDYDTGDDVEMPTSYNARDLDLALGYDLSENSHIEFGYIRLDETDTEFPGQIFDIGFLVTDGYTLRYVLDNQCYFDHLTVDTWYNRTRFEGDAQGSGKRRQIPQLNSPLSPGGALDLIGFTDVDLASAGFRAAATWGQSGCPQWTIGADLRYLEQELNEFDDSLFFTGNFPIARSHSSNPGVFAEHVLPVSDRLTVRTGARADWVSTNLEGDPIGRTRAELRTDLGEESFNQHFQTWAAYLTAEYTIDCRWTLQAGVGHAERPPTLTELYAFEPFLAVLQQGFNSVIGDRGTDPERLWQVDLELKADYGDLRAGVNGFYAWIHDYITFENVGLLVGLPPDQNGILVAFLNTDLATLAGGEMYLEYDWNCWITPFANLSYVEGRDHSRSGNSFSRFGPMPIPRSADPTPEEPLPGIGPLESRTGLRIHEAGRMPRWGVELAARIVDNQDRVASSLLEQETAGFAIWDLRSYWRANDSLLLVTGIENFTDKDYREHLDLRTGNGVFQPGINFYFGVEVTY